MRLRSATWISFVVSAMTLVVAAIALRAAWTVEPEQSKNMTADARQDDGAKAPVQSSADSADFDADPAPDFHPNAVISEPEPIVDVQIADSPVQIALDVEDDDAPLLGSAMQFPSQRVVSVILTVVHEPDMLNPSSDAELEPVLSIPLQVPPLRSAAMAAPNRAPTRQPAATAIAEEPPPGVHRLAAPDPWKTPIGLQPEPESNKVQVVTAAEVPVLREPMQDLPDNFEPWWQSPVMASIRNAEQPQSVTVDQLVLGALRHSPRVRAISTAPLIREAAITAADARFDWRSFMDSRFASISEPVGSTLKTGGPSRFREQNWNQNTGLRRTTTSGANVEIAQRLGYQDNNSVFFQPTQQGNARLSLSFNQPLLNGAGCAYNTSLIVLAQIDADLANDEFSKLLQDHLLEVTRAYWELYGHRAVLLQKQRLLENAVTIHERLESRRGIDALKSQIARSNAAVESRKAEIIRCEMNVRNTESRLRVLVNDPMLLSAETIELLPQESPAQHQIDISLRDSLTAALENRPELLQAAKNVRAASVRLGISENELLPALDLVTEAYVAGLKGAGGIGGAFADQFSEGQPSFTVGVVFEMPLCNRAAKARNLQRRLELQQLTMQLQQTTETLKAEVEVAVRSVNTAFREMQSKYRSMLAAETEVRYLTERWRLLPGEDQVATFLLEDLLSAQERQTAEEADFVTAQITYTIALSELKRATGTLLQAKSITATRVTYDGLPQMILDKRSQ